MSFFGPLFTIIYLGIIVWIIYRVMRSVKQNGTKGLLSDPNYRSPAQRIMEEAIKKGAESADVKKVSFGNGNAGMIPKTNKEPAVTRLMDDREHDWLARQLSEERAAKRRMSAMFELKQEHAANCDAYDLKSSHAANCDAEGVVDNPGTH